MLKSKKIVIILCAVLLCLISTVGGTVAFLAMATGPVRNVFVVGDIALSLTETTGSNYQMIPGKVIDKNPKVKVHGGSEDCYLFVKISKTDKFDDYFSYSVDSEWTHLGGHEGIYYRSVEKSDADVEFHVLYNDIITVKDNLTKEKMSAITEIPKLTFEAFAIQSFGMESANEAWHKILGEVDE